MLPRSQWPRVDWAPVRSQQVNLHSERGFNSWGARSQDWSPVQKEDLELEGGNVQIIELTLKILAKDACRPGPGFPQEHWKKEHIEEKRLGLQRRVSQLTQQMANHCEPKLETQVSMQRGWDHPSSSPLWSRELAGEDDGRNHGELGLHDWGDDEHSFLT